jgi:hypothetical protein
VKISTFICTSGALVLGACAHTKPDEMSAADHRAQAAQHEKQARSAEDRFDPDARRSPYPWEIPWTEHTPQRLDNPTIDNLRAAEAQRAHAAEHRQAATELEQFEETACVCIPAEGRASCPLVTSYIIRVEEASFGARLLLKKDAPIDRVEGQMSCHLAFAKTRGFSGMPDCPLYRKGVTIRRVPGEQVIEVRGNNPKAAALVRADARRMFPDAAVVLDGPR